MSTAKRIQDASAVCWSLKNAETSSYACLHLHKGNWRTTMQTYQLKKKNLPADVLVLKEIAKRVLSGKQYRYLIRKHILTTSSRKLCGRGLYSHWRNEITVGIAGFSPEEKHPLIHDYSISVFLHELAHMCHRNNRLVNHNKGHHRKTFWKILGRLEETYKTEVKQKLPEIVSLCQNKQDGRLSRLVERREAIARARDETKLPSYKLIKTQKAIAHWQSKLRRCETHLKKLRRREKLYTRLIQKKEGDNINQ